MHSHILSTADYQSRDEFMEIVEAAQGMMSWADAHNAPAKFPDIKVVLAFFEASTRTHKSFKQAALNLGLRIDEISGAEGTSLVKGESFADTARMLAGQGADIIVTRTTLEGGPRWIARVLQWYGRKVKVINAGDGKNQHPSQTMLDLLTIMTHLERLDHFRIGLVGDLAHGRTAVSLIQALKRFEGVEVVLVAPEGAGMLEQYKRGINIVREADDLDALADCHIVYVTRFQLERIEDPVLRDALRGRYVIDQSVLDNWLSDVRIMHPLPSVEEISNTIKRDPRLIAFRQAELGIPTRMALLHRACTMPFVPYPELCNDACMEVPGVSTRIDQATKPPKHFQPIDRGTVFDHIPPGKALEVIHILEQRECLKSQMPRIVAQHVKSRLYGGKKDVLLLTDMSVPSDTAAVLAHLFPQITVNTFPGDGTKVKQAYKTPTVISGVGVCPNRACITRHDPEAKSSFIVRDGGRELQCEYCERLFTEDQIER